MITPYKNRKIDFTKPVKVYRNLHNGKFSITQRGAVVGHCSELKMQKCMFLVNQAGRQRVIATKHKNVHAFICGFIVDLNTEYVKGWQVLDVYYNPYQYSSFVYKNAYGKHLPIYSTKGIVHIKNPNVYCQLI